MAPIGIRYFDCRNAGIGIIIYPQLRSSSNPGNDGQIVWDGRKDDNSSDYKLYINSSVRVDLGKTGIGAGTQFVLSENTVFGTDMWDGSQVFSYDPSSKLTAYGTKWGGAHDGSFSYGGTKSLTSEAQAQDIITPFSKELTDYAFAVASDTVDEVTKAAFPHGGPGPVIVTLWKGLAAWATGSRPADVYIGSGVIMAFLRSKGYAVVHVPQTHPVDPVTLEFLIGPKDGNGDKGELVPEPVIRDWDAAVAQAARFHAINEGITDIPQ